MHGYQKLWNKQVAKILNANCSSAPPLKQHSLNLFDELMNVAVPRCENNLYIKDMLKCVGCADAISQSHEPPAHIQQ